MGKPKVHESVPINSIWFATRCGVKVSMKMAERALISVDLSTITCKRCLAKRGRQ